MNLHHVHVIVRCDDRANFVVAKGNAVLSKKKVPTRLALQLHRSFAVFKRDCMPTMSWSCIVEKANVSDRFRLADKPWLKVLLANFYKRKILLLTKKV